MIDNLQTHLTDHDLRQDKTLTVLNNTLDKTDHSQLWKDHLETLMVEVEADLWIETDSRIDLDPILGTKLTQTGVTTVTW